MQQAIEGFHMDAESHWVADLACGHKQHVRHAPPFFVRPWVITDEGRKSRLGTFLNCVLCDEAGEAVAQAVLKEARSTMLHAYEDAGMSGLCAEGRFELALDALREMDLRSVTERALRKV